MRVMGALVLLTPSPPCVVTEHQAVGNKRCEIKIVIAYPCLKSIQYALNYSWSTVTDTIYFCTSKAEI